MADDVETEELEEEQEVKEKKSKKFPVKLIIIIASVIIGGGILAFGGFFLYTSLKSAKDTEISAISDENSEEDSETVQEQNTLFQNLDTFYVNIGGKNEIRYLKITISLELSEKSSLEHLKKLMPKIKDDILILLSTKTIDELSPANGKMLLKNQIKTRINQILKPLVKVVNVYFTEFIIQ